MSGLNKTSTDDLGKLVLRVTVAGLILFHGIAKLVHGVAWMREPLAALNLPFIVAYGVYVAEIIAPVMMVIGFRTRLAALTIVIDMIMAILLVLRPMFFTVRPAGGGWGVELEMFYLLAALTIFLIGGGRYSLSKAQSTWD